MTSPTDRSESDIAAMTAKVLEEAAARAAKAGDPNALQMQVESIAKNNEAKRSK